MKELIVDILSELEVYGIIILKSAIFLFEIISIFNYSLPSLALLNNNIIFLKAINFQFLIGMLSPEAKSFAVLKEQ